MATKKITQYPAKLTFNDGDLFDISTHNGLSYNTEKMTMLQLVNYLGTVGGIGFSGDYTDLTNKPTLFDGAYSSLTGLPTLFDGNYSSLSGLPTLFDGAYSSLSGLPTLFDGAYSSLSGLPTLFSGDYDDLTNKPTDHSTQNYLKSTDIDTLTELNSIVSETLIAEAPADGTQYVRKNNSWDAITESSNLAFDFAGGIYTPKDDSYQYLIGGSTSVGLAKFQSFNGVFFGNNDDANQFIIDNSSTGARNNISFQDGGTRTATFGLELTTVSINALQGRNITFGTGNLLTAQEKVTIFNSTGNLRVGTGADDGSKLQVDGDINLTVGSRFKIGNTVGLTDSGNFTNFNIVGGIIMGAT